MCQKLQLEFLTAEFCFARGLIFFISNNRSNRRETWDIEHELLRNKIISGLMLTDLVIATFRKSGTSILRRGSGLTSLVSSGSESSSPSPSVRFAQIHIRAKSFIISRNNIINGREFSRGCRRTDKNSVSLLLQHLQLATSRLLSPRLTVQKHKVSNPLLLKDINEKTYHWLSLSEASCQAISFLGTFSCSYIPDLDDLPDVETPVGELAWCYYSHNRQDITS